MKYKITGLHKNHPVIKVDAKNPSEARKKAREFLAKKYKKEDKKKKKSKKNSKKKSKN